MALIGSFNTNSYDERYLKFAWELENQNASNGESIISWRLTGEGTSTNKNYYPISNVKVTVDDLIIYVSDAQEELWEGTVVASGSYTLTQTSSGAKTFSVSVEASINTTDINCNGNGSWSLPSLTISSGDTGKNSAFSLSASVVEVGSTITASISSSNASYTHDVEFFISGYGGGSNANFYQKYTGVATSQSFTIPDTWYKYMVSSDSCTAYCKVTTKNGSTQVGNVVTKPFTVKILNTVVPTVGTIVLNPDDVVINGIYYNYLIKEKNKFTINVYECEASPGSKIKSYKFSGPSVSNEIESMESTASYAVDSVHSYGTLTYKVTVTDSRGRVASATKNISCYNYQNPYFMNFNTSRSGTVLSYTYKVSFSDIDGKNSAVVNVYIDGEIADTIDDVVSDKSETRELTLSSDTTHQVYATVTDALGGYSTSKDTTVFSDAKILNVSKDYFGLAFGKMCEQNGFECDWDAQFNGDVNIGGELTSYGDIHANNLKLKGNIVLGPDSTINYGKIDMDGDFVTSDELPQNLSDLVNDMDFINSITATQITKDTITAPYIATLGLTVGNEIKMGPNATISWSQLPSDVASSGDISDATSDLVTEDAVTIITQNAIQTGDLHLRGNLYRMIESAKWWESDEYMMVGINSYNNLQLGSPKAATNESYSNTIIYSPNSIYFAPDGISISQTGASMEIASGGVLINPSLTISCECTIKSYLDVIGRSYFSSAILPNSNGLCSCGISSNRWSTVYTQDINASGDLTVGNINSTVIRNNTTTYVPNMYVGASGEFYRSTNTSSRTIKDDIVPLQDLDLKAENLYNAEVVQFKYKPNIIPESDNRYRINMPGFIVEDLEKVYSIAVDKDEDGNPVAWNYQYLLPPMLKLIQDHKKEIDALRTDINSLKAQINELKGE